MQGIHTQRRRIKHAATASPPEAVVFSYTGKGDTAVRMTENGRINTERSKRVNKEIKNEIKR
jgi:hypothetical protein